MVGALILALCAWPQSEGFTRSTALASEGRFAEACALAESLTAPVERAQALVFVRLRAGDLPGALAAAEAGAAVAPRDAWLQERRASLALSLGATELAARAISDLEAALSTPEQRAQQADALEHLHAGVAEQRAAERARESALTRARAVVAAAGAALLVLLARFALTTRA